VSGGKGRHGPIANTVCCHFPNSRLEAESLLAKA
jgi:hypothetical protein